MQHLGVSSLSRKTNLVKSRSREFGCYDDGIAMNVDSYLGSAIAEVPVKFQSDWKGSKRISRFGGFTRFCGNTSVCLVNKGPKSMRLQGLTRCNLLNYGWRCMAAFDRRKRRIMCLACASYNEIRYHVPKSPMEFICQVYRKMIF